MPSQESFLEKQFDKLLVTFVFLIVIALVVLFAFLRPDAPFKWAIEAFGLFFGLFSGLITGYHMGKNSIDPPQPPPVAAAPPVLPTPPKPSVAVMGTEPDAKPYESVWTPAPVQLSPQK